MLNPSDGVVEISELVVVTCAEDDIRGPEGLTAGELPCDVPMLDASGRETTVLVVFWPVNTWLRDGCLVVTDTGILGVVAADGSAAAAEVLPTMADVLMVIVICSVVVLVMIVFELEEVLVARDDRTGRVTMLTVGLDVV